MKRCQLGSNPMRCVSRPVVCRTALNYRRGYTAIPEGTISPTSVSVQFIPGPSAPNQSPLKLLTNGEPEPDIDETRASEILQEEDLEVLVDLGGGEGEAKVWTCDFSHVSFSAHCQCEADWGRNT